MSKKVVSFTLPPRRSEAAPEVAKQESEEPDTWIFEPRSGARSKPQSSATETMGSMVIDLSADRTWFELAGLICVFPYLATWCWMQNATGAWLNSLKQR